uniref:Integrase catalytic domain-containing protein n=1 Tax=Trichobilharzia regenti TaxID=157069 RepID=A0AA85K623_TRIRE|nr:unnamed protein product [Trichobilharzia regenti]
MASLRNSCKPKREVKNLESPNTANTRHQEDSTRAPPEMSSTPPTTSTSTPAPDMIQTMVAAFRIALVTAKLVRPPVPNQKLNSLHRESLFRGNRSICRKNNVAATYSSLTKNKELNYNTARIMGIRKTRTTAYHPQENGLVERMNRTLKSLLQAFVDQNNLREWDRSLSQCLMAY